MLIVIGLIIGIILGLTGAGGSVFAVPLLMVFLDLPAQDAMGLALAAVALSASYGIIIRLRRRVFFVTPALLLGATGVATAPVGKWVAAQTPEQVLEIIYALLAVGLSIRMWRAASRQPESTRIVRASSTEEADDSPYLCRYSSSGHFELKPKCISGLLLFGLVVGFLSGFLGVGGGFLIIPILLFLSEIPMQKAVGTSLLIIAPVSFSGFISYWLLSPNLSLTQISLIVGGGVLGMTIGTRIAQKVAGPTLQRLFAASLVLLIGISVITS